MNKKYLKNRAQVTTLDTTVKIIQLIAFEFGFRKRRRVINLLQSSEIRVRRSRDKTAIDYIARIAEIVFLPHNRNPLEPVLPDRQFPW